MSMKLKPSFGASYESKIKSVKQIWDFSAIFVSVDFSSTVKFEALNTNNAEHMLLLDRLSWASCYDPRICSFSRKIFTAVLAKM